MTADIYWISGLEPGRLAILGRPRAGDWLNDEIADWRSAGVTDVVSLLEDDEMRELGLMQERETAGRIGICFERFPIPDRGVPASFQAVHSLWSHLAAKIRAGQSVGVHCRAGIGRSGLIVAGTLVQLGIPGHEAWARTARARGIPVPDTEQQKEWLDRAFSTGLQHRLERPNV
jgi:protein-tyrosine phosphatase